jgi:hypothetical protein
MARIRPGRCPHCGFVFDAAAHSGGEDPSPGDLAVCFACAGVMVLDAALRPRRPAPGAYAALKLTHPVFYAETERFREALLLFHARAAGSA